MHCHKIPTDYSEDTLPIVLPWNQDVFQWTLTVHRSLRHAACEEAWAVHDASWPY